MFMVWQKGPIHSALDMAGDQTFTAALHCGGGGGWQLKCVPQSLLRRMQRSVQSESQVMIIMAKERIVKKMLEAD